MKKTSIVFVAALSFAAFGCKKKGADCGKAIANSMEVSKADMTKMPGVDDKMMEKMRDLGLQHCQDDKWPEDAVKCMSDAKTMADAQGCYGKLTPEQRDTMEKARAALMTPPGGAGAAGSAGAGGSGGAGGAMGSDTGAGSAPAGSGDTAGSAAAPK